MHGSLQQRRCTFKKTPCLPACCHHGAHFPPHFCLQVQPLTMGDWTWCGVFKEITNAAMCMAQSSPQPVAHGCYSLWSLGCSFCLGKTFSRGSSTFQRRRRKQYSLLTDGCCSGPRLDGSFRERSLLCQCDVHTHSFAKWSGSVNGPASRPLPQEAPLEKETVPQSFHRRALLRPIRLHRVIACLQLKLHNINITQLSRKYEVYSPHRAVQSKLDSLNVDWCWC